MRRDARPVRDTRVAVQYYEDRWTPAIYSRRDLQRTVEAEEVPRTQVPRRFRALARSSWHLLDEAEMIAAAADWEWRDRA